MYAFVRITATIFILLGILVMIAGVVTAVVGGMGLMQTNPPQTFGMLGVNPSYLSIGLGLATVFQGLLIAAFGQLLIVVVDIAVSTHETQVQLRSLRRTE